MTTIPSQPQITSEKFVTTPYVIIKALLLTAIVAILFGLSDSMVTNWDHTLHMETIQQSTPFIVDGWRGYGTGYYRLAATAKLAMEPIHDLLRVFGLETLGIQAAAIFVNLALLVLFILIGRSYLAIDNLSILAVGLSFAISPLFQWMFRIYPDVALAGLLGICLVLVLGYAAGRRSAVTLSVVGILYALALHIKQPAILLAPSFGLLLLVSPASLWALVVFGVSVTLGYAVIGYPSEYQLVNWLLSYVDGRNEWMSNNSGEITPSWLRAFSQDAIWMAVIPSLPFLLARSELLKENALGTHQYRLIFGALACSFVAVFLAFILKPVTVVTQHYMIISMPLVALIFLMLPIGVPVRVAKHFSFVLILALLASLYQQDWRHPKAVLAVKAAEIQCQPAWREGISLVANSDLRSPYIPFGIKGGSFFMAPGTLYDRLPPEGSIRFLVNNHSWLSRFSRSGARERSYGRASSLVGGSDWRSPSSQVALDRSFEMLEIMANMGAGESIKTNQVRINVIFDEPDCKVRVFEIAQDDE